MKVKSKYWIARAKDLYLDPENILSKDIDLLFSNCYDSDGSIYKYNESVDIPKLIVLFNDKNELKCSIKSTLFNYYIDDLLTWYIFSITEEYNSYNAKTIQLNINNHLYCKYTINYKNNEVSSIDVSNRSAFVNFICGSYYVNYTDYKFAYINNNYDVKEFRYKPELMSSKVNNYVIKRLLDNYEYGIKSYYLVDVRDKNTTYVEYGSPFLLNFIESMCKVVNNIYGHIEAILTENQFISTFGTENLYLHVDHYRHSIVTITFEEITKSGHVIVAINGRKMILTQLNSEFSKELLKKIISNKRKSLFII